MLRSILCDYRDTYILLSATITVPNTAPAGANRSNKQYIIIETCAPFTNCISEINNTQLDNVKYIDIVMLIYNLIEYGDNNSKTSGSLW